ncbi:hypothetical protein B0I35DRAFT_423859 [Stachybotrys elegans]|uniref:BZIP domain-containing protein n=1 Tax=Stachybotrys elegans TaxID=80388 RepID=A0A8K0SVS9_9HYPO|nr:hypothetical protein B0I35DRAFT_423859 [Stachybotrys elegans]
MSDTAHQTKQVSDRRRQQNVRAQKKYRERQKRRMECLEDLLSTQVLRGSIGTDLQQPSSAPPSSSLSSTPPMTLMESLGRLVEQDGNLDDDTRARIESGQVTLQAILKAGLETLQLQQVKAHSEPSERIGEESQPVLRTDKILVTRDRMHGHPGSPLPSVHTNHLRMKQFLMVAALRANAELLEVTFQQLTDPDAMSPFYGGDFSTNTPEVVELAGVDAKFLHLKPDLRPTIAQIKRRHHPYMDLFPCPIFRQRMIELTTAEPPIIDEGDLCRDIEKDGIICWGSQLSGDHAATGSGAPWDMRSWEMEPWFLKKWWFLVGGTDGAFYQQSRWWCEVRGDELSLS